MPHLIVEYSKNLEAQIDVPGLLEGLHEILAGCGIDKARIKTRGIALDHAVVGDKGAGGAMMHATLLLLTGRDIEKKKSFGDPLHKAMKNAAPEHCAVTLEIRDMVPETYYL